MAYTVEEVEELNKELKEYQNKFKRLINGLKWDCVADSINDGDMSVITIIMNAKSYKDISWLVMYNAENTLKRVREKYNNCKLINI